MPNYISKVKDTNGTELLIKDSATSAGLATEISDRASADTALGDRITDVEGDVTNLTTNVNNAVNGLDARLDVLEGTGGKFVLIGDSYLQGYSPDGNVTPWSEYFIDSLGIEASQVTISALGGTGFSHSGYKWYDQIAGLSSDTSVTAVIIAGGYNDAVVNASASELRNDMSSCYTLLKSKFPSAKYYVGFIGRYVAGANDTDYKVYRTASYYQILSAEIGYRYLNNVQFALTQYTYTMSSDGYHPNVHGQELIGRAIASAYLTGSANCAAQYIYANPTPVAPFTSINHPEYVITLFDNELVTYINRGILQIEGGTRTVDCNLSKIPLFKLNDSCMYGSYYDTTTIQTLAVLKTSDGKYHTVQAYLTINAGTVYLTPFEVNSAGSNYNSYSNVTQIQLGGCTATMINLAN